MTLALRFACVLVVLGGVGCQPPLPQSKPAAPSVLSQNLTPQVDPTAMMETITWLSHPDRQGRRVGSPEEEVAAHWIADRFKACALRPLASAGLSDFIHTFPIGSRQGRNVVGMLPGKDATHYLLLAAHYDHLGSRGGTCFPGADDNASGVAVMLECMRVLASQPTPPARNVVFVAFSGEEMGLLGSRHLSSTLKAKGLAAQMMALNLEMFGPAKGASRVMDLWDQGRDDVHALLQAVQDAGKGRQMEVAVHAGDDPGSDAHALSRAGVLCVSAALAADEKHVAVAHPHFHSPRDVPGHIDADLLQQGAQVILDALLALLRTPSHPASG